MTTRRVIHRRGYAMAALLGILVAGCSEAGETAVQPRDQHTSDARLAGSTAALSATPVGTGLLGGSGSAVGPAGDLYVAEPSAGRIARIDPQTGSVSPFFDGLPPSLIGIGGVMDVGFLGATAYALITLVGPDLGGTDVVGVYRLEDDGGFTVVADIGAWSMANPPATEFFVPTGVHYSMEPYRGGFLVADGHHNRVLHVRLNGEISEVMTFDNTVPTGLALAGNTIYMAEAGPVPHLPEDGRVVAFGAKSTSARVIASGAPLLVDVEPGRGQTLFALSQGPWDGAMEASPALPSTGSLLAVTADGELRLVVDNLDRPTSMEIIGNSAFIVTLTGEVWRVDDIAQPPYGS